MIFKVNGERNSGTNFLQALLEKNYIKTYVQKQNKNILYHWKHGVPDNSVKKLDSQVVEIFIFRKLNSWLVSMFHNPYELEKKETFYDFLTTPQKMLPTNVLDYRTKEPFNKDDDGKTIFEIRYYKYNKIMEYKKQNKDVILVSLEHLQNRIKCGLFLKKLKEKYSIKRPYFIIQVETHTKEKKKMTDGLPNRSYPINVDDYKDIIDKYKNDEIENHINNLTYEL